MLLPDRVWFAVGNQTQHIFVAEGHVEMTSSKTLFHSVGRNTKLNIVLDGEASVTVIRPLSMSYDKRDGSWKWSSDSGSL